MKRGGGFFIGMCFIVLICFGSAWAEEVAQSEGSKDYQVFDLG